MMKPCLHSVKEFSTSIKETLLRLLSCALRSISGTFKFCFLSLWVPTGLPQLIARAAIAKKMGRENKISSRPGESDGIVF